MLESKFINKERHKIGEIPLIRLVPKYTNKPFKTIIFYHGWSSTKEIQLMRGMILAGFGYQVILPDALYHGERGKVDYSDPKDMVNYFWPTILQNLNEYREIRDMAIKEFDADSEGIAVMGNSMGGFSASGIFTYNPEVKALTILNGSANWSGANTMFKGLASSEIPKWPKEDEEKIREIDPMNNISRIVDRPILLVHGSQDEIVDKVSGKEFYKKAHSKFRDKDKICFIEYNRVNHTVTTNMMEDSIRWFKKFL